MQKQAAFWLALCCMPDYLILDEPVDGLDPVMRRQVWSLVLADVAQRGTTVLVSSHNLRELEDVCDHVGIMDHGKVLLERSLAQLQDNMVKLQVVFPDGVTEVPADLPVLHASRIGRIHTLIMRMNAQEAEDLLAAYSPLLVDAVPLTLEEIFIYELEVRTMLSKTSYFNATLFRRNLTRFWPLWGLASFIGALFPLAVLLDMVHRAWHSFSGPEFTQMYYNAVSAVPVISLVYAALCAMAVWGYLHNTRSVGLMHTLPIRREGLFLTNFLSGLTMTLIPYAVTGILCVVVSLCGGAFDARGLAVTVLAVLGESFFYFSSATFVAFITGNVFAMPPLYALLHFLAVLLDWLISSFAQGFIFGFSTHYTGVAECSPPPCIWSAACILTGSMRRSADPGDGTSYTDSVLTAVDLENFWLVASTPWRAWRWPCWPCSSTAPAAARPPATWWRWAGCGRCSRYGVAGLCALLGGQLLYSLFWYGFQQGAYYDTLPMVVCLLAAGTIGYYGASMLLAKSLRVFRGSWRGLAFVLAGCALICCVLHFDLLGVADRVPKASQIRSVDIRVSDNSYTFTPEQDADLVEQVRALHQAVAARRPISGRRRLRDTPPPWRRVPTTAIPACPSPIP